MKIRHINGELPFVTIDNVFSKEELSRIFLELDNITPYLNKPSETGASFNPSTGAVRKNNKGIFLFEVYADLKFSSIYNSTRNFFNRDTVSQVKLCHPTYSVFKNINLDHILISYYENGGYYLPHDDSSYFTILTWLYKEPKNFTGGDLIFPEYNITVPVRNNAGVIFNSGYLHEVTKVNIIDPSLINTGRYTITNFCFIRN